MALKFLPAGLENDTERLERLFAEVRLARQISHNAVCRVFDIGEVGGRHFLSMEYVDGENMASLLRRVGRVPKERAIEMARQLCAGLAAAHDKGILHRDLKPQNVLVDGKGRVRIVDFGLAAAAEAISGREARSGTPAYMAPEQLAGREVTVASDVYSLGLVLYELFTGKRAIAGKTLAEVVRAHDEQLLESPSQIVSDMDPAVERAILRCLEKDPRMRPRTALAVAAALPGGDPVAAALAAGETPSPEMVAALGRERLMPRWLGWVCVITVAAAAVVFSRVHPMGRIVNVVPPMKPPAVLIERAQQILGQIDAAPSAADGAWGFGVDYEYYAHATKAEMRSMDTWRKLRGGDPPLMLFWYRQANRPLFSLSFAGMVSSREPPLTQAGMSGVRLDTTGRLVHLYNVPPQLEGADRGAASPEAAVDWAPFFAQAGLDMAVFRAAEPRWTPPFYVDERAAWEGRFTFDPSTPLRVEAASYRGRPVWFELITPWSKPERQDPYSPTLDRRIAFSISVVVCVAAVVAAIVMARRNLQLGRSDRRGAGRIALYVFVISMLSWLITAHHVAAQQEEIALFLRGLGWALVFSVSLGLFYLALEPYVRRLWPRVLVSWARLLAGGVSDPVVGQDVLIGAAVGALTALLVQAELWFWARMGRYVMPNDTWVEAFQGPFSVIGLFINQQIFSLIYGLMFLLLLVLLRLLLRREWLAAAVFTVVYAAPRMLETPLSPGITIIMYACLGIGLCFLFLRFGLLSALVTVWIADICMKTQWVTTWTEWTAAPTLWAAATMILVAGYGLWASRRGRPITVF